MGVSELSTLAVVQVNWTNKLNTESVMSGLLPGIPVCLMDRIYTCMVISVLVMY